MNTLLLHPTDVLFFRDGRPMEGSLAGHGAAWPLPSVVDAALHAALHRSELPGHAHGHRQNRNRREDTRRFGSLVTAGPFPVRNDTEWFLPRPLDLGSATLRPTRVPSLGAPWRESSSLPKPLTLAVGSTLPPEKDPKARAWISSAAYSDYLAGSDREPNGDEGMDDADIFGAEATIGIGIDDATGTQDGERIYSARYLRLKEGWGLGCFAKTAEKSDVGVRQDVISQLFRASADGDSGTAKIVIGGQQRICTARLRAFSRLPLPMGRFTDFETARLENARSTAPKHLVKWVLLSPAIWPEIGDRSLEGRPTTPHPGGWLPNWVNAENGRVLLRHRTGQLRRDYSGLRHRRIAEKEEAIAAHLVAALVGKPVVVTGWALPDRNAERAEGGAKPTHLAVPAGSVYYFACDTADAAAQLAAALNWHGDARDGTTIARRRSTLFGEKGFGLGVCGTWSPISHA